MTDKARLRRLEKKSRKVIARTKDWDAVAAEYTARRERIVQSILDVANGRPIPADRHPKGDPIEVAAARQRILRTLNMSSQ